MVPMDASADLLIAGGTLLDPATGLHAFGDVAIAGGRITAIGPGLSRGEGTRVIDARGAFVTPGLIDMHLHGYWGVNPFGMDVDGVCLATGVTTGVDAGSAGPVNFGGYRALVHDRATTRMLAFVALAQHGVWKDPGELEDLRFADPAGAARTVAANRDVAVGIKVRLHVPSVGDHGREALRLAIEAGETAHVPVMVHVGSTGISMEEIVDTLRPGDIVTHCFTPQRPSVVDDAGRVLPAALRAQERGVIFDVAHANNHFEFGLVRRALDGGLVPDVISTDLHGRLAAGNPVVDLPTTMTKLLALGMPVDRVVAACTATPARVIGWGDRIGSLQVGREADVAVLDLVEGPAALRDSVGGMLTAERSFHARWTVRAGVAHAGGSATAP
jgi:dihydroorotase